MSMSKPASVVSSPDMVVSSGVMRVSVSSSSAPSFVSAQLLCIVKGAYGEMQMRTGSVKGGGERGMRQR